MARGPSYPTSFKVKVLRELRRNLKTMGKPGFRAVARSTGVSDTALRKWWGRRDELDPGGEFGVIPPEPEEPHHADIEALRQQARWLLDPDTSPRAVHEQLLTEKLRLKEEAEAAKSYTAAAKLDGEINKLVAERRNDEDALGDEDLFDLDGQLEDVLSMPVEVLKVAVARLVQTGTLEREWVLGLTG